MQLVVVMAVKKAVSAATTTFTAISTIRFFISFRFPCHPYRLLLGSGTDVKSRATFSSGPDISERPRRVYPCAFCSAIQSSRGVTFLMYCFLVGSVSSGERSTFSSTP